MIVVYALVAVIVVIVLWLSAGLLAYAGYMADMRACFNSETAEYDWCNGGRERAIVGAIDMLALGPVGLAITWKASRNFRHGLRLW